jgi:hypothetical protein
VAFTDNQPGQIISAWMTSSIGVNQHVAPNYAVTPKILGDLNLTTPSISDQAQPLYYPLTTSGLGGDNACDVFSFGSGSIYERSSNVTGSSVGTGSGSNFIPSLFAAQRSKTSTATICASGGSSCQMIRTSLGSLHKAILDDKKNDVGQNCTVSTPEGCLSTGTQISGPGIIAVPLSSTSTNGTAIGLFLVFDPSNTYTTCGTVDVDSTTGARTCRTPTTTTTCSGNTYVVFQELKPVVNNDGTCSTTSSPTIPSTNVYFVGAGVSSGMAIGQNNQLLFARSGSGTNAATVVQGSSLPPVNPGGSGTVNPTWWMELK